MKEATSEHGWYVYLTAYILIPNLHYTHSLSCSDLLRIFSFVLQQVWHRYHIFIRLFTIGLLFCQLVLFIWRSGFNEKIVSQFLNFWYIFLISSELELAWDFQSHANSMYACRTSSGSSNKHARTNTWWGCTSTGASGKSRCIGLTPLPDATPPLSTIPCRMVGSRPMSHDLYLPLEAARNHHHFQEREKCSLAHRVLGPVTVHEILPLCYKNIVCNKASFALLQGRQTSLLPGCHFYMGIQTITQKTATKIKSSTKNS